MPRGQLAAVNQRLVHVGRFGMTMAYPLPGSNTLFSAAQAG
jgi:hypothetical protein